MKVLAVGREAPWRGPRSGLPIRRGALLRGAARVGDLDYVTLSPSHPDQFTPPPEVATVVHVPTVARATGARGHLTWQFASAVRADAPPYELSRLQLADAARTRVTMEHLGAEHDVIWVLDKHAAFLVGGMLHASGVPVLLDVEELVGDRARQEAGVLRAAASGSWDRRLRARARIAYLERNARAWDDWTERLGELATVCTVSNPRDAGGIRGACTVVVPNGCDVTPPRDPPRANTTRPTLLFHGLMGYEPNTDAAVHLVRDILPELDRALGRDFEVRIVGRAPRSVEELGHVDRHVTVTGYVDDIGAEVRAADVVVVPLRVGSGTRLKVLEAMAMGTPVVSTTVGCDGLAVTDGEHLLVADSPARFAAACVRAVDDTVLRRRLVDRAYRLVATRYDWRIVEAQVEALTREQVTTS